MSLRIARATGSGATDAVGRVTQVTINGKQGQLGFAEGGTGKSRYEWLIFPDSAGHKVLVQVPASLGLTQAQVVSFAQGITVTKAAKAAAG